MRRLTDALRRGLTLRLFLVLATTAVLLVIAALAAHRVVMAELRSIRDVIDADIDVGGIDISPLGTRVEIRDLLIRRGGEDVLSCRRVVIPLHLSLERRSLDAETTTLEGVRLSIRQRADGSTNLDGIIRPDARRTAPPLPPILVTHAAITFQSPSLPSTLALSDVQLSLLVRGNALNVELYGAASWMGGPVLCRRVGLRGSLTGVDDLDLNFLMRDLDGTTLPPALLGGRSLTGTVHLRGRWERLRGTSLVSGILETPHLRLQDGLSSLLTAAELDGFAGSFRVQVGSVPMVDHPRIPDAGGLGLSFDTDQGSLALELSARNKRILLEGASAVLAIDGDRLTVPRLRGRLLGSNLEASVDAALAAPSTVATTFALRGLDAKALANVMPFSNFSLAGSLDLQGTVRSSGGATDLRAELEAPNLKVFVGTQRRNVIFHLGELAARVGWDGRLITLERLGALLDGRSPTSVHGQYVPGSGDEMAIDARIEQVDADYLLGLLGSPGASPIRPGRPIEMTARLHATPRGPRLRLQAISAENVLTIHDTPIPIRSGTVDATMLLPGGEPPEGFETDATFHLDGGGTITASGSVPLVTTAPLRLTVDARSVSGSLLTTFITDPPVTVEGRCDVTASLEGTAAELRRSRAHLTLPSASTLTLRREVEGIPGSLRVAVAGLDAQGSMEQRDGVVTVTLDTLTADLSRGGRVRLAGSYLSSPSTPVVTTDFVLADVDPGLVLETLGVQDFGGTGRATIRGTFQAQGATRTVTARIDLGRGSLEVAADRPWSIPVSDLHGSLSFVAGPDLTELRMEDLTATVMGGRLVMAGTNRLDPDPSTALTFSVTGLETKDLCRALMVRDFSARGPLSLRGTLGGTLRRPRVEGLADFGGGRLFWQVNENSKYTVDLGAASSRIVIERDGRGYVLRATKTEAALLDGRLLIGGTLRLTPSLAVDAALTLENATAKKLAAILAVPDFSFAGTFGAVGTLSGPASAIRLDCRFRLAEARLFYRLRGVNLFYQPPWIEGTLGLDQEALRLDDVHGPIHDGAFRFGIHLHLRDEVLWNATLTFEGLDLGRLARANLRQRNDLGGRITSESFIQGKGSDPKTFAGRGTLQIRDAVIRELASLDEFEREYRLRNLRGIGFETVTAKLKLLGERLTLGDVVLRTTRGSARGEGSVGFDTTLAGSFHVSLDRSVLSSGHRLLSLIEGGNYFDFDLALGGTTDDPDWKFRSGAVERGALIGAALLFSPAAPAVAIFGGLRTLFGGKHRSSAGSSSPTTSAPSGLGGPP